jgi:hypothetical protein
MGEGRLAVRVTVVSESMTMLPQWAAGGPPLIDPVPATRSRLQIRFNPISRPEIW